MRSLINYILIAIATSLLVGCNPERIQNQSSIVISGDDEIILKAVVKNIKNLDLTSFKENDNSIGQKVIAKGEFLFEYSFQTTPEGGRLKVNSKVPVRVVCEGHLFIKESNSKIKIINKTGIYLLNIKKNNH